MQGCNIYIFLKVLRNHLVLPQNISNRQLNFKDPFKSSQTLTKNYDSQGQRCNPTDSETYVTPNQPYLGIKTKTKIPVNKTLVLILNNIFKYTISPVGGKTLKMSFKDIISLTMKATTVRCITHKFSTYLYKHKHSPNKCKIFCLLSK